MRPLLALLLLPALASAGPRAASDPDRLLTLPEYRQGLKELRGHFVRRNEDPAVADKYVHALETAFQVELGENVPVTRGVFDLFLRYQAAWARKTRDSKNPKISREQLEHEVDRARQLKAAFKSEAELKSPRFYAAFQSAVQDVRAMRRRGAKDYAGVSNVFFSDQVDESYSHVDAGDEALEKGDNARAISEANLALQTNPANADALVLRAAAEYDQGNKMGAINDAQAALVLDPGNRQAQAILSLTSGGGAPDAAKSAMRLAESAAYAPDGAKPASARGDVADVYAGEEPTATPAVGRLLAADISVRAAELALSDPRASQSQFGQAMALDPANRGARDWHATVANRAGDYRAALGSANLGLAADPDNALAYYNKAYALAGEGDKTGMIAALTAAAKLDPTYQPTLDQALALTDSETLDLLFGMPGNRREPPAPQPRHHAIPGLFFLAGLGAAFVVGAVVLWFRPTKPKLGRVKI